MSGGKLKVEKLKGIGNWELGISAKFGEIEMLGTCVQH